MLLSDLIPFLSDYGYKSLKHLFLKLLEQGQEFEDNRDCLKTIIMHLFAIERIDKPFNIIMYPNDDAQKLEFSFWMDDDESKYFNSITFH